MAWEGFFFFVEAIFRCFIVFIFDLHMYCDDMLINWNRLFFFPPLRSGDGLFKMYRPMYQLVCGCGFKVSNCELDPNPGLEDFLILWLAANY